MCDRVGFIEEMFIIPLNYLPFVGRMHFSERNDKCEWMPHYNRHNPFTTLNVKPVVSHFYHVFLHASIFLLGEILKVEIWSSIHVRFDLTLRKEKFKTCSKTPCFSRIFCEIEEISHAAKRVSE